MSEAATSLFAPRIARRRRLGGVFQGLCLLVSVTALAVLLVLLSVVFMQGYRWVSWDFLSKMPSQLEPKSGGMHSAIIGTLWMISLTALLSVPTGIGAAIYLHEYARSNRFTRFIQLNIANLAGVPSIVYGILGLAIFVRWMHFNRSVLAGAMTMSLLILPVIIIASREALVAVPNSLRAAAYALGATRWQMVRYHVLPAALPGMMTGIILALSRAIGETAPLIMIGALTYIRFTPGGSLSDYPQTVGGVAEWFKTAVHDDFTAMPIQIFNWAVQPHEDFHDIAAAGILVLLGVLLTMNAAAVAIRAIQQGRLR